jgi:hypothetical protein
MSFTWLGTFNKSQFDRFLSFARSQLTLIDGRIQHLDAELRRVGRITFQYKNGISQGYSADPTDSYLGKLFQTYVVLGGNPNIDLRLRLFEDPVFLVRGTETVSPQYMSNGEVVGAKGLSDAPTGALVRQARSWLEPTLDYRFDVLERKIRRATDYADQLNLEKSNLLTIREAVSSANSLENVAQQIQQFIADPNYRAIFDDHGADPLGQTVYAPFSSYDSGSGRTNESAQRQNTGFVPPSSA